MHNGSVFWMAQQSKYNTTALAEISLAQNILAATKCIERLQRSSGKAFSHWRCQLVLGEAVSSFSWPRENDALCTSRLLAFGDQRRIE